MLYKILGLLISKTGDFNYASGLPTSDRRLLSPHPRKLNQVVAVEDRMEYFMLLPKPKIYFRFPFLIIRENKQIQIRLRYFSDDNSTVLWNFLLKARAYPLSKYDGWQCEKTCNTLHIRGRKLSQCTITGTHEILEEHFCKSREKSSAF